MNITLSLYEGVNNWNTPTTPISGKELYEMIRTEGGGLAELTNHIQHEYTEERGTSYKEMKAHLPKIVPGLKGMKTRSSKTIEEHDLTGLITLDVDDLKQIKELKDWFATGKYKDLPYIYMAFRSASGYHNGSLCVIVRVSEELFPDLLMKGSTIKKAIAEKFTNDTGLNSDTKNGVTQARFLAHDPEVYYNPTPSPITRAELPEVKSVKKPKKNYAPAQGSHKIVSDVKVQTPVGDHRDPQYIMDWAFQRTSREVLPGKGTTHYFLGKWIPLVYKCGVPEGDAISYANSNFPTSDDDHETNIRDFYNSLGGTPTEPHRESRRLFYLSPATRTGRFRLS